jgi:hypothetical protein
VAIKLTTGEARRGRCVCVCVRARARALGEARRGKCASVFVCVHLCVCASVFVCMWARGEARRGRPLVHLSLSKLSKLSRYPRHTNRYLWHTNRCLGTPTYTLLTYTLSTPKVETN